jgi:predicted NodU family carbamoyl transferase
MRICGIHDGRNAAACLVRDGRLVSAVQEERLTCIKNWTGFPALSIEAQLNGIGAGWQDVDAYVFAGHEHYICQGEVPAIALRRPLPTRKKLVQVNTPGVGPGIRRCVC